MQVSVLQENLAKGLGTVIKAVDSRPQLPILANILLNTEEAHLTLAATNLQLSITMRIGAKVSTPGAITLPAKTFTELVNNLSPERVDMSLDPAQNSLRVQCGATDSNVKGIDAEEYPVIHHNQQADIYLEGSRLKEMIQQTAFASAKEDGRPILTGVYTLLEGQQITMAAADGYRLAVRTTQLDEPVAEKLEMVIPARALNEVARAIGDDEAEIGLSFPNHRDIVTFHFKNLQISSQILEGRFPDFRAIIPKGYVTSTVMYTSELLRACKRAEIFARDNANSGRLEVRPATSPSEPAEVFVSGRSTERGDNRGMIDASAEGEPLDIAFNIKYLIEVLNVIEEERVIFQSNGAENPGVIRPENRDDFIHVIMPMKS